MLFNFIIIILHIIKHFKKKIYVIYGREILKYYNKLQIYTSENASFKILNGIFKI